MKFRWSLTCLGILCLASGFAAPLDYRQLANPYIYNDNPYGNHVVDDYGYGPTKDELLYDNQGLYYPEDPSLYLDDSGYGFRNPGTTRNPQYYNYYYRTPVGDISGDDIIAAVSYRNSPTAYYYEVAEAGPRHLKVIYYNGYTSPQSDSDSYYYY